MAKINTAEGVVPSDASIQLLDKILQTAYSRTFSLLQDPDIYKKQRAKQILFQIREVAKEADLDVRAWIGATIPSFYEHGAFKATKENYEQGKVLRIDKNFAHFHKEAVRAISQDTYQSIASGMTGLTRTAERVISNATRQKVLVEIATGRITGSNVRELSKRVKEALEAEGITAITDRAGRQWDLLRYGEMLARTKLTQAHNTGIVNRMAEGGYDLVLVTTHRGACELCRPWEGKVLSVTGRNRAYPSLDEAQAGGLFHPNCRHTMTPYHETWADNAVVWDTKKQEYVPFKQRFSQNTIKKASKKMGKVKYVRAVEPEAMKDVGLQVGKNKTINIKKYERDFLEKHKIALETKGTKKDQRGFYDPIFNRLVIKGNQKQSDIEHTFFHEFGHAVDFNVGKMMGKSRLTQLDDVIKVLEKESDKIAKQRLFGVIDEWKKEFKLSDEQVDLLKNGKGVIVTKGRNRYGLSMDVVASKYKKYINSPNELFAEGYRHYRQNKGWLKKEAPGIYNLIDGIVKERML